MTARRRTSVLPPQVGTVPPVQAADYRAAGVVARRVFVNMSGVYLKGVT